MLTQDRPDSLFGVSLRALPENIQAEQSVLGSILANNKVFDRVSKIISAEDFADPIHSRIYAECARRIEDGQMVDAVTLKNGFEHAGILDAVGGTKYLAQLMAAVVAHALAVPYAKTIFDCAQRRRLIHIGETLVNSAFGGEVDVDPPALIERVSDEITALMDTRSSGDVRRGTITLADAIAEVAQRADDIHAGRRLPATSLGIGALDRALNGGVEAGTLTYLLGLGGIGKTELAFQAAEYAAQAARQKWLVRYEADPEKAGPCPGALYISLGDMTAVQLAARSAARLGNGEARKIRRGELDADTAAALVRAAEAAISIPVELNLDTSPTSGAVKGEIRRFVARRPCVLVVIDNYSDLLSGTQSKDTSAVFQAIGITRDLKKLAKDLEIPILLLMHFKQAVGERPDPTPRHGDIPWGTGPQADSAVGVWRPILGLSKQPPPRPGKLSDKGEANYAKQVDEWHSKRKQLAGVTEFVPLKLREDDDGVGGTITRALFDQQRRVFSDIPSASDDLMDQ